MHLAELFKRIVLKYPDNTALIYKDELVTYLELDKSSSALARKLQKLGVKDDTRVGVLFKDSYNFINTILAVVKLSAIYIPFDVRDSQKNIEHLCEQTSIDFLLYDNEDVYSSNLNRYNSYLIQHKINEITEEIYSEIIYEHSVNPVLYIMFTSGTTTGKSKGVLINHSGISRLVIENRIIKISPTDILLQASSVAFDASSFEIWGALLNGAALVLVESNFDYLNLGAVIDKHNINILWLTTKLFETLVVADCKMFEKLKYLVFGGESASYKHIINAFKQLPNVCLINGYGPTENTVFTTMHLVNNDDLNRNFIPIGNAVNNTDCYVFDDDLKLVNEGEVGMLHVGGQGLAHSYLDEQSNKEKFIVHPINGTRLYNTGDFVRFSVDFGYEYIGRMDRQIKVRGYRIELDLIEDVVTKIENVLHAYVFYHSTQHKHALTLFYTTKNKIPIDKSLVVEKLQENLPWYSLPSVIQFVDDIPYNNSNKVDVVRLIEKLKTHTNENYSDFKKNGTLENIWLDTLRINTLNLTDNFFDIGGDSLSSLILITEVNKAFNLNLKTSYLIANPSFVQFKNNLLCNEEAESDGVVLLKKGDIDVPVFLLPPLGGGSEMYYLLSNSLDVNQDVYSFNKIIDVDYNTDLHIIDNELVRSHAKKYADLISKAIYSEKVVLAGYSLGGNIALAVKLELDKMGVETVQIHLLDSYKLGNTAFNNSYEIGCSLGFVRKSLYFIKESLFNFELCRFKAFLKTLYKKEINPEIISSTPVFLYRCSDLLMKMKDEENLDWQTKIKQLKTIKIKADHNSILKKGFAEEVGRKMSVCLKSQSVEQSITIINPFILSDDDLDKYLRKGWFRIKQQLFTDTYSLFNDELYPILWLRYRLDLIICHRSHKQIIQKNKDFRYIITDLDYDKNQVDLEGLYQKYFSSITFHAEKSVKDVLYNTPSFKNVFRTKSILLYDKEELIGVGIFDIGEQSAAQILYYFDPAYSRNSIGKYLILLTTRYLRSINYRYFYVGFVYIGHSKLDYKLFIGKESVEYLNHESKEWQILTNRIVDANLISN